MKKRTKDPNKKRLRWWQKLLIVVLVVVIGFIGFSIGMIRHFTGDTLSFKGTLAMVGYGGFDLPDGLCKFILDTDRSYEGLPDILTAKSGKTVKTEAEYQKRREEMLSLYETYMYGKVPKTDFETSFIVEEEGTACNGKALRRQVRITTTTDKGSSDAMLLLYLPADTKINGIFVGENFSGNTAVSEDEKVLPSVCQGADVKRGLEASSWPVELIVSKGYGVATTYYGDWAADDTKTYRDALLHLFSDNHTTAYGAWAFGIMRSVDYLESSGLTDEGTMIASVGHSRLARVSLWAGANDSRIRLVTASCGGGLQRSEILGRIAKDGSSDHWYTKEHWEYVDKDSEFPVDTHMLYALCADADRHLYISMGSTDLASDPVATYDALQYAKVVWRDIYGRDVIPDGSYDDLVLDEPVASESVATHVHKGGHMMNETDWKRYMEYADSIFVNAGDVKER